MVDIWLIFNLMIPFILVLAHTYMDTLRTEETETDGEKRTINHHGKSITVNDDKETTDVVSLKVSPAPVGDRDATLIDRNEQLELNVRIRN